jgi:predicted TPR repeat methyltransferase
MPITDPRFEAAKQHFLNGLEQLAAGRLDAAEQSFTASLALVPQRVSTLINLAATRLRRGKHREALEAADEVLALEPHNTEAGFHRASALGELGRHDEALAACAKVLALDPALAPAWSHRGSLLRELGRFDEAAQAFEQALAHGGDAELNGYYLASVVGAHRGPATAPRRYVESLFDGYAGEFDSHLLQVLGYRAPEVLARQVEGLARGPYRSALDLGCGTGLCGPLVKPMAARLTGVDLSAAMLDKARALGVYDRLVQADIVEHLRQIDERPDLIVAADVFIYVGDLAPVFDAVRAVLMPGGVFGFSAELARADESGFALRPSLRYAHAEPYLLELARQHGFSLAALHREPIRSDQRETIDGLYVSLIGG